MVKVHRTGSGPALLLLAGCGSDRRSWTPLVGALADSFTVLTFDWPGLGESPDDSRPLVEVAQEALPVEGASVLGHSMGGMVAQELAQTCPERVHAMALVASFHRLSSRAALVLDGMARSLELDPALHLELFLPWLFSEDFLSSGARVQIVRETFQPPSAAVFRRHVEFCRSFSGPHPRLPTMLVAAEQDLLSTPADTALLGDAFPEARLNVIPGGHACALERPAELATAVASFFQRSKLRLGVRQDR